jgi:Tol biopolymer transport system component
MPLSAGTRLGPYEILALIGAGGMGEVYRARDPRLGRDVAIKLSKEQFSERFEREARAVAALNHSNICTLYDVGPNYLVMEVVEGPTLAERIKKGAIPLEEALAMARQISDALASAHDKGIVHRDLKPANLKITPQGVVKVLDFGLAKAVLEPSALEDRSLLSTEFLGPTQAGEIVGTPAYMAPEQIQGMPASKRADIWAFGVVLHEMLSGRRMFRGATLSETLAAVLKDEPDWDRVPAQVQRLLRSCLQKDPVKRLRDIGDVWQLLDDPAAPLATTKSGAGRWAWPGAAAILAMGLMALALVHFRQTPPPDQTLRYNIAAPESGTLQNFAISPDGRYLVMAMAVGGKQQLWLRAMDALQAQPMPFTEDAAFPFWSPDSRYIGFFAQDKLKRVPASGGPAQSLCAAPGSRGGSWSHDDVILFSRVLSIQRVAAAGGDPVDVSKPNGDQRYPVFLPDSRHFLYLVRDASDKNGIYVGSLDGQENRRVLADSSDAVFAPPVRSDRSGHILFVRNDTLMAVPFDPASAQVSGEVFPVAEDVVLNSADFYLPATISDNGVLVYAPGPASMNQLGWYDRTGKSLGLVGAPGAVLDPAISPDEKSIVFARMKGAGSDLWVRDLSRGTETRFTSDPSLNLAPSWSPKGDRIVFASDRGRGTGAVNLYQKATSGSGQEEPLLPNTLREAPSQWSRDGRFIVYWEIDKGLHLWVLPTEGAASDRKPILFLKTKFYEYFGQLSPDSHWMAYASNQSGRFEVYVRPFPPGEGEWPVSVDGG